MGNAPLEIQGNKMSMPITERDTMSFSYHVIDASITFSTYVIPSVIYLLIPSLVYAILQEKILEIEYIKAVAPRKEEEPSLHDDWVSAVDGSNPG